MSQSICISVIIHSTTTNIKKCNREEWPCLLPVHCHRFLFFLLLLLLGHHLLCRLENPLQGRGRPVLSRHIAHLLHLQLVPNLHHHGLLHHLLPATAGSGSTVSSPFLIAVIVAWVLPQGANLTGRCRNVTRFHGRRHLGLNDLELQHLLLVEVDDKLRHHRHVVDDDRVGGGHAGRPFAGVDLVGAEVELQRPPHENAEGRLQFETVLEEADPGKDVEAEAGAGHGHHQTADIAQVADIVGAHQGEEDVVVLLALVLVHGGNLVGQADERVVGAARAANVAQQRLLTVVGRQDGNLVRGIACKNVPYISNIFEHKFLFT